MSDADAILARHELNKYVNRETTRFGILYLAGNVTQLHFLLLKLFYIMVSSVNVLILRLYSSSANCGVPNGSPI